MIIGVMLFQQPPCCQIGAPAFRPCFFHFRRLTTSWPWPRNMAFTSEMWSQPPPSAGGKTVTNRNHWIDRDSGYISFEDNLSSPFLLVEKKTTKISLDVSLDAFLGQQVARR